MLSQNSSSTVSTTTTIPFHRDEIENQIKEWKKKLNKYNCPISKQLITEPVTIETRQTFDKNSIKEYFKSKKTCPVTKKTLKSKKLTPILAFKSIISETVEKYIKKVIKHVKLWSTDSNLIDLCSELINESLELIKKIKINNYQKELYDLKLNILLNEKDEVKLFNNYMKIINELSNLNFKILQLQKLEHKFTDTNILQQYCTELINLIIESKNADNNKLLKEIFTQYCKLNELNNELIENVLSSLDDEMKLDCLISLYNYSEYNRNSLINELIYIKLTNINNEFIAFFKNLFKEIDLTKIDLYALINFIEENKELNDELNEEKIILYKEIYKFYNDIEDLESL